jgi:hypothetical protein
LDMVAARLLFFVGPFTSHVAPHAKLPSPRTVSLSLESDRRQKKEKKCYGRFAMCFARRDMACPVCEGHAGAG